MARGSPLYASLAAVLALAPACKHFDFPFAANPPSNLIKTSMPHGAVDVRYLGSGGFLIKRGQAVLMTAPLFTNPYLPDYFLGKKLRPRRKFVRDFVDSVNRIADGAAGTEFAAELKAVTLVVSGHAHYDHLLDVPAVVAAEFMNGPTVLTSLTGKRTLTFYQVPNLIALNEPTDNYVDFTTLSACDSVSEGCSMPGGAKGKWWPSAGGTQAGIRVLAVSSDHPPQLGGVLFWPGCHAAPLTREPTSLEDWRVGEVIAFLIDFLDTSGQVAYRIYYEDAPLPPCRRAPLKAQVEADKHEVDLALLCTGNYKEVPGTAGTVCDLGAREVILHHWEWFFDETTYGKRHLQGLPGSLPDEYRILVAQQLQSLGVDHPDDHIKVLAPGVRASY